MHALAAPVRYYIICLASLLHGRSVASQTGVFPVANIPSFETRRLTAFGFNATGTSRRADAIPTPTPVITPASITVSVGTLSFLSVVPATVPPSASFQWNWNDIVIPGATGASYAIANPQVADAGRYTVTVTSTAGTLVSSPAILIVTPSTTPIISAPYDPPYLFTTLAGTAGATTGVAVDGSGNVFVAEHNNRTVRKITAFGAGTTLAGGSASAVQFSFPLGVAVDMAGTVYVADFDAGNIIKVLPNGVGVLLAAGLGGPLSVAVNGDGKLYVGANNNTILSLSPFGVASTLAGTPGIAGYADGTGRAAQFFGPWGVAVDKSGITYVADISNYKIRKVTPGGTVTTVAGNRAGYADGAGTAAQFNGPFGVAVDNVGNLYVADTNSVRKVDVSGIVTTLGGGAAPGYIDGIGKTSRFSGLRGIAVDRSGNIYVSDSGNSKVRKGVVYYGPIITTQPSALTVSVGASASFSVAATGPMAPTYQWNMNGSAILGATNATFTISNSQLSDVGVYTATVINLADSVTSFDATLAVIPSVVITPANITITAGTKVSYSTVTNGAPASSIYQWSVNSLDIPGATSAILTIISPQRSDAGNYTVRVTSSSGTVTASAATLVVNPLSVPATPSPYTFTTLAGSGAAGFGDGPGISAQFNGPTGVAVDGEGNVFVADLNNNRIRKITVNGVVSTLAGSYYGTAGSADGLGDFALFNQPMGIAVNGAGNIYVADQGNLAIRSVNAATVVTTLISFRPPSSGGPTEGGEGPGYKPPPTPSYSSVSVDRGNIVYVTDSVGTVYKILPTGARSVLAGGTVGAQDGVGPVARFNNPSGVAVDGAGNVYVADRGNFTIRKIAVTGAVSTLAGSGSGISGVADGAGIFAQFNNPTGVAVDEIGNVYVTDQGNNRIRMVTPGGVVSSLAGSNSRAAGYSDGFGSAAHFNRPTGVAVDRGGNIYVADTGNNRIRKGTVSTGQPRITTQPVALSVNSGESAIMSIVAEGVGPLRYEWRKDGVVIPGATNATLSLSKSQPLHAGSYTVVVTNSAGSVTSTAGVLTVAFSRLVNLSILTSIDSPGESFTMGYVVGGGGTSGSKPLVLRAAGPSLGTLGVNGILDDPMIEFFAGPTKTGENDNWGGSATLANAMSAVGAFVYTASTSRDAAAIVSITNPENSMKVSAAGRGTGTVIAEIYDATPATNFTGTIPRLVNVSVLKSLGTGFTVGFVVAGSASINVLVRAIGPSLGSAFGIGGTVADPQLTLYLGQTVIGSNNNWGGGATLDSAFSSAGAFPLPSASRDAAIIANLNAGNYTVQVTGVGGVTGTILVEIYELP